MTACWRLTRQRFRAPSCPFRLAVGFFFFAPELSYQGSVWHKVFHGLQRYGCLM